MATWHSSKSSQRGSSGRVVTESGHARESGDRLVHRGLPDHLAVRVALGEEHKDGRRALHGLAR